MVHLRQLFRAPLNPQFQLSIPQEQAALLLLLWSEIGEEPASGDRLAKLRIVKNGDGDRNRNDLLRSNLKPRLKLSGERLFLYQQTGEKSAKIVAIFGGQEDHKGSVEKELPLLRQ